MTTNEMIPRYLDASEIHTRRKMLEQFLDELDSHTGEVAEKRREIKEANVEIERITARTRDLRQEIRTGTVWEPAPPRQKSLEFADTERERPKPNGNGPANGSSIDLDDPDPEHDKPELVDKFAELYPPARTHNDLRNVLHAVLADDLYVMLVDGTVEAWEPGSRFFDAVAHWARVERAHADGPSRPPIAGMLIPQRLPMPEALAELLGVKPPKKKRGARPLTSGKGKKSAKANPS